MTERLWTRAYRVATAGVLAGWLYGVRHHVANFAHYERVHVVQPFFPAPMASAWLLALAWLVPAVLGLAVLVHPHRRVMRVHSIATAVGALVLLCHLRTFGYQVFATAFWAALWLTWVAWRAPASRAEPDAEARTGCFLIQAVVSLVFLGAVAGKWTAGYWSGETLFHMMFVQQHTAMFDALRQGHSLAELRAWSVWYARLAVVTESVLAASFLFPRRIALVACALGMLGQWLVTTPDVIEVLLPLFGLVAAGLVLDHELNLRRRASGSAS